MTTRCLRQEVVLMTKTLQGTIKPLTDIVIAQTGAHSGADSRRSVRLHVLPVGLICPVVLCTITIQSATVVQQQQQQPQWDRVLSQEVLRQRPGALHVWITDIIYIRTPLHQLTDKQLTASQQVFAVIKYPMLLLDREYRTDLAPVWYYLTIK